MAPTAEELIVSLRAEGTDEAQEGVEGVEGSFDDAADSVGDSADEMQGFATQWQGAMGAVVAGLAVASAGLLSQVPVIGELFGGLVSVIEAIAFQMDQVLRPVLQPLTNAFFDLSAAIYELDGAAGTVVGVATTLGTVLAGVGAALTKIGVTIAGVSAGFATVAAAVGAFLGVLGVLALDELGVLDFFFRLGQATREFVDGALARVKGAFRDVISVIEGLSLDNLTDLWDTLTDIGDWATSAVEGAFDWISSALEDPLGAVEDILGALEDITDKAWAAVVDISLRLGERLREAASGTAGAPVDFATGLATDQRGGTSGGGLQSSPAGGQAPPPQNKVRISLNGRTIADTTKRYSDENVLSRGVDGG